MRFYRWLLRLFPAGFRAVYGDEMCAVFAEKRRRATGPVAVAGVWVQAVADLARHALPLHLDTLRYDLRYTFRSLVRAPVFTFTVIAVSALGIGANTAVFTVVDRVLIRPLPFADADRIVRIWESPPGYSRMEVSPPNYADWQTVVTSFDGMAAYYRESVNLVGEGDPERISGARAGAGLFSILGVGPHFGRVFGPEHDVVGAQPTVVLSYGLWQRSFGGDPDVLGRTVVLDDQPHVVLGVMPAAFSFPSRGAEYWAPLQLQPSDDRTNNYLEVVARLKDGVTVDMARQEMLQIMRQLEAAYPVANERNRASVNRLQDEVPRQARLLLLALMGASVCVLLIACTNLANLLLARAMTRRQELAVRSSLGAGRERLIRQLLTESLTLSVLGGGVGILLAYASLPLLAHLVPPTIPLTDAIAIDLRIIVFALSVTGLTGIGFGALPAVRAGAETVATGLRDSARGGGMRGARLRATLVVAEVAGSVVLLIASGLLLRALSEVRSTDPGFRTEGVLTARTWLPNPRYETIAARTAFYTQVLANVRALPGVESAAYTSFLPLVFGGGIWPVEIEGLPANRNENHTASLRFVTPDYFATMGIPVWRGRDVSDSDTQDQPYVAVVSRSFAERYWPDRDPIGQSFGMAFGRRTIVGVVDDVRVRGLERASEPQVYLPHAQIGDGFLLFYSPKDLAVRVTGDPNGVAPALREIVGRADPLQPVSNVQSLDAVIAEATQLRSTQVLILGGFAALAFALAAVGIHGLLAFTATHRAREIGVRMALGAPRRGIATMFLREGAALGVIGVLVGVGLGYVAGRTMEALLLGIGPLDVATFGSAVGLVLAMTVLGSLPPALRAASVDPNTVMREG